MESFELLDYPDVKMEKRGSMVGGRLKLSDKELLFKPSKSSSKSENVSKEDIDVVNWQRLAGSWGIRIFTNDGKLHRFAGFKETEREKLAKFFSQTYGKDMLDRELSVKGWNWGMAMFNGDSLTFEVDKADAFEIPLPSVQQCSTGKNEVALEFEANDESAVSLSEIRFHIASSEVAGDEDPVEAFKEAVMKKSSGLASSGDALAILNEIQCLAPRGRYSIKIYPNLIHLHGKTFDYKILTASMVKLFMLPHHDGRQMHLVLNCDPPMKHGQTRYHFLVLLFKEEETEEIELPLTEEEIKERYDGILKKEMCGKTYEIISKLLKAVTGRKLTQPGSFVGFSGTPVITCNHKASSGFLYPLEKGIVFIYKPPLFVRYDDIHRVEFERTGGSSRSFDLIVTTKHDLPYTFSSIEKGEYSKLFDYLKSKKVKVTTAGMDASSFKWGVAGEKEIDHHLEKVKQDAESTSSGGDDMSSDDYDFNPDQLEALSAKEEYDSEPSTTSSEDPDEGESGSDAERRREERRKEKEEKKSKKDKHKSSSPSKESSNKTKKKTKIAGQPKRPQTAFFLWLNENREQIKKDHPDLSLAETSKKAGEIWREMEDKSEWNAKADEDKKRYEKEYEKWKADGGEEKLKEAKKREKKSKGSNVSKSSKSSDSAKKKENIAVPAEKIKSKEFIDASDDSTE